jgi:3-dehydroquinate synthase
MSPILSNSYYVYFNNDGYTALNNYLVEKNISTLFILVDENTNSKCLPLFLSEIATEKTIEIIEIEPGESFKNLDTCIGVWEALTDLKADRKSLLLNLGGGVITDLGGFVAAAYKRGISFINIPTTLLSMVDASVGGKTGVDLGVLKNQIGVFANPEMVLIDTRFLSTLSQRELYSGIAEIIKYALTFNIELLHKLDSFKNLNYNIIDEVIFNSITIKNNVVLADPKEQNLRKVLNFGHTLGHAIESYFLESDIKKNLTHGEAIAVGMICASYISHVLFNFPYRDLELVKQTILGFYKKVPIEKSDFNEILELMIHDKKNVDGQVNFVLLTDFEAFKIDCAVENELVIESINYYNA